MNVNMSRIWYRAVNCSNQAFTQAISKRHSCLPLLGNRFIGTDKGVLSAKQLGTDKRIAMWQPDAQAGVIVLQRPPVPKIAHQVPWIE